MTKNIVLYLSLIALCYHPGLNATNFSEDTLTICCNQEYLTIDIPDTLLSFYEVDWITRSGELYVSDSTLTFTKSGVYVAIGYDTLRMQIFIDSFYVQKCQIPIISSICASSLPISILDMGLHVNDSFQINGQMVSVINRGDFPENLELDISYTYHCDNCSDCFYTGKFLIISNTDTELSIDHEIRDSFQFCKNDSTFKTLIINKEYGSLNCIGCVFTDHNQALSFNASSNPVGRSIIIYRTTKNECELEKSWPITIVDPIPTSIINLNEAYYCTNDAPLILLGEPPNGQFYLNQVSLTGNRFNPGLTPPQDDALLEYRVLDHNGCRSSISETLAIRKPPDITFSLDPVRICADYKPFELTGQPIGGDYLVDGSTKLPQPIFDATAFIPGNHSVTYQVSDDYCSNSIVNTIQILPLPDVRILNVDPIICENQTPFKISRQPAGGLLLPVKFSNGNLDPNLLEVGIHTVSYYYEDPNGCSNKDEVEFQIVPKPYIAYNEVYRCDPQTLNLFNFSGGTTPINSYWTIENKRKNNDSRSFGYQFANPGLQTIKLTVIDQNKCSNDSLFQVYVPYQNISHVFLSDSIVLVGEEIQLRSTSSSPLINSLWVFGDGSIASDPEVTHVYHDDGIYNVLLSTIDTFGCNDTAQARILVKDPLNIDFEIQNLYPNPTSGISFIEFYLPETMPLAYTVINGMGQHIFSRSFGNGALISGGKHTFQIDLSQLDAGIYFLDIHSGPIPLSTPGFFDRGDLVDEQLKFVERRKLIVIK